MKFFPYVLLFVIIVVVASPVSVHAQACDPKDATSCGTKIDRTPSTAAPGGTPAGVSPGTTPAGVSPGTTPAGVSPGTGKEGKETLKNPLKFNSLPKLIEAILGGVVQLGAILLAFMLVWVGFLFVVAQGNPEKVSAARSALVWTVIGGLILLGATAISKVIQATVQSISS